MLIIFLITMLWLWSVYLKDVSIVDAFWGCGFVILAIYYFFTTPSSELHPRKILVLVLVGIWGLRLSLYLLIRNWGKPEDFSGSAIFLASNASNYVNGEILTVDGGWMGR